MRSSERISPKHADYAHWYKETQRREAEREGVVICPRVARQVWFRGLGATHIQMRSLLGNEGDTDRHPFAYREIDRLPAGDQILQSRISISDCVL